MELRQRIALAIERITPTIAADWMRRNISNRKISRTLVSFLSQQLRQGEWIVNGETLIFDWDDNLLNGQHRLKACLESGVSFTSVIVRGIDPAAFKTMDTGSARRLSDVLYLGGELNPKILATAIRTYWVMQDLPHRYRKRLNHTAALRFFEQHPELRKSVEFAIDNGISSVLSPGYGAAFHYATREKDQQLADDFWSRLATGERLQRDEAVYTLRERLIQSRTHPDKKLSRDLLIVLCIRAWNSVRLKSRFVTSRITKNQFSVIVQ